jgi:RecB family endonuclease NucS
VKTLSEVINWMKNAGPKSIVLYVEYYDNSLSEHIYRLPEEKDAIMLAMTGMLLDIDMASTEDINIDIYDSHSKSEIWDYPYLMEQGMTRVLEELNERLQSVWENTWSLSVWHRDGNGSMEFSFRRHNFV